MLSANYPSPNSPTDFTDESGKVTPGPNASRTHTAGGVLQDRRQDLGVGDGFTHEQPRSLHFRVSPDQPDGVKRDRSRDRADRRGVAGKNVVEPLKSWGAVEIGSLGRV